MCADGVMIVQHVKKLERDLENVTMDFHDDVDIGQVKKQMADVKAILGRLRIRQ